jgi:hypothetical protein
MARRRASRSGKMTCPARRRTSRYRETCDGRTARVQVWQDDVSGKTARVQVWQDDVSGKTARIQLRRDMRRQDGAHRAPERHATARRRASKSCKMTRIQVRRDYASRSGKRTRQDGAHPGLARRHASRSGKTDTSRSGETCDGWTARVQVRQDRHIQVRRDIRRLDGVRRDYASSSRPSIYLAPRASMLLFGVVVCVLKSRFEFY